MSLRGVSPLSHVVIGGACDQVGQLSEQTYGAPRTTTALNENLAADAHDTFPIGEQR